MARIAILGTPLLEKDPHRTRHRRIRHPTGADGHCGRVATSQGRWVNGRAALVRPPIAPVEMTKMPDDAPVTPVLEKAAADFAAATAKPPYLFDLAPIEGRKTVDEVQSSEIFKPPVGDLHSVQDGPPDAPTVVLLYGLGGSTEWWAPVLPALRDLQVVRVDLLGHGRSAQPAAHGPRNLLGPYALGGSQQRSDDQRTGSARSAGSAGVEPKVTREPSGVSPPYRASRVPSTSARRWPAGRS